LTLDERVVLYRVDCVAAAGGELSTRSIRCGSRMPALAARILSLFLCLSIFLSHPLPTPHISLSLTLPLSLSHPHPLSLSLSLSLWRGRGSLATPYRDIREMAQGTHPRRCKPRGPSHGSARCIHSTTNSCIGQPEPGAECTPQKAHNLQRWGRGVSRRKSAVGRGGLMRGGMPDGA